MDLFKSLAQHEFDACNFYCSIIFQLQVSKTVQYAWFMIFI